MLGAWGALQTWTRELRVVEEQHRVLDDQARRWHDAGGKASGLLDDGELRAAEEWLARDQAASMAAPRVLALIEHSRAAIVARDAAEAARVRALREQVARYHVLLAQTWLARGRGAKALPYLLAAREVLEDDVGLRSLFEWARRIGPYGWLVHDPGIVSLAWSADGMRLTTVATDRTLQVWDPVSVRSVGGRLSPAPAAADDEESWPSDDVATSWAPAGDRVAIGSSDSRVYVVDVLLARAVFVTDGYAELISAHAWSPDGRRLAVADGRGHLQVHEMGARAGTAPVTLTVGRVEEALWCSADRLATLGAPAFDDDDPQALRLWDTTTGTPRLELATAEDLSPIPWITPTGDLDDTSVTLSAGGDHLACVARSVLHLWNVRTGARLALDPGDAAPVLGAAWSADGELAIGYEHPTIGVWDAADGKVRPADCDEPVDRLVWSPDGAYLAGVSALDPSLACVWSRRRWQMLQRLPHRADIDELTWRSDGGALATIAGGVARIWRMPQLPVQLPRAGYTRLASWSPDGRLAALGGMDRVCSVWHAGSGRARRSTPALSADLAAMAWHPRSTMVAVAGRDGCIRFCAAGEHDAAVPDQVLPRRTVRPEVAAAPQLTWNAATDLGWSHDGARLVASAEDGGAYILELSRDEPITRLPHGAAVLAARWSPASMLLATGSVDGTARIWDGASGTAVSEPLPHDDRVDLLAWSPDGAHLATVSGRIARVYDTSRGVLVARLVAHRAAIAAIAWSPDGTRIVTGGADRAVRIWDAISGRAVVPAFEHQDAVTSVAWSSDRVRIATGSVDKTARIWDARSGTALAAPLVHADIVLAVHWHPDGDRLLTAAGGGFVWDLRGDDGALDEWRHHVAQGDYDLDEHGVLTARR